MSTCRKCLVFLTSLSMESWRLGFWKDSVNDGIFSIYVGGASVLNTGISNGNSEVFCVMITWISWNCESEMLLTVWYEQNLLFKGKQRAPGSHSYFSKLSRSNHLNFHFFHAAIHVETKQMNLGSIKA